MTGPMTPHPLAIVIIGGGVVSWLLAASLAPQLTPMWQSVTVIETPGADLSLGSHAAVTTATDATLDHLAALGLGLPELVKGCQARFVLGTLFHGFDGQEGHHFRPLSSSLPGLGPVQAHQLIARARMLGLDIDPNALSLAALAAAKDRVCLHNTDPDVPAPNVRLGLTLDIAALTETLKAIALCAGAKFVSGNLAWQEHGPNQRLMQLGLHTMETVPGDLFIDASGPSLKLIGQGDAADWTGYGPPRQFVTLSGPTPSHAPPFQMVTAHRSGWQMDSACQSGLSRQISCDPGDQIDLPSSDWTRVVEGVSQPGFQAHPWQRNVIALGAAADRLDPIDIAPLDRAVADCLALENLLPRDPMTGPEGEAYNRQHQARCARIADLTWLRFGLNGRAGQAYWDACRDVPLSPPLQQAINLYRKRGWLAVHDNDPVPPIFWTSAYESLGIRPDAPDPQARAVPQERLMAHLSQIQANLQRACAACPTHAALLNHLNHGLDLNDPSHPAATPNRHLSGRWQHPPHAG